MFKRIVLIAALTGIGQLVSIFALKFTSKFLATEAMTSVAQVDALIFFLISIIGLGLQPAAIRNIAISQHWHSEYEQTQSARLILSLILFIIGLSVFIKPEYITFFLAPLLALSGDYALYALGKPVQGAIFACIRMIIPYFLLVVTAYFNPDAAIACFIISWGLVYLFTNKLIANTLRVQLFIKPRWRFIKLYLLTLPLGLVSLSFYFLGVGLLLIIPYFYSPVTGTVAFIGLKFYMVFKGVLRIIHQAFVKEMIHDEWCLRIDQLSIIISLIYLGSLLSFPNSFITFFFGQQFIEYKSFFIILAVSGLVYSTALSSTTKALLQKKDIPYTIVASIAAAVTILCTILISFFKMDATSIGLSLLLGEVALFIGLILISSEKNMMMPRLAFLLSNSILLIIPFILRFWQKDALLWLIVSIALLSLALLIKNARKFSLLQNTKLN